MAIMSGAKLITCCYCGAQDVFKIHKGTRRSLACLSCGAPMRKITTIKVTETVLDRRTEAATNPQAPPRTGGKQAKRHAAYHKKRKKKKGWVAELWDDLDDIFDIEDWFD